MKRIVLDTNVTISAFFWNGSPRNIYNLVKENKVLLFSSPEIEKEFIRVLSYPRFGLTPSQILPIVNDLRKYSNFIEVKLKIDVIKEDPTDNIFLECAIEGNTHLGDIIEKLTSQTLPRPTI